MGAGLGLPKAVTSVVVKRAVGSLFRVGLAEMNGWRASMEDAHVIHMQKSWGFFGVFDGHGGDQCSKFIAKRLCEELSADAPEDDEAVKSLVFRLDEEFLATKQPSGSTGTFVIIHPEGGEDGRWSLRVGNIGDSRVLLGRADGTIVEGPGTDGGLTTDHKPDHPSERERIERTGGHVQDVVGVARVNGDLAVSRAFGDAQYKESGGPSQEDHPVTAAPEFTRISCGATDFVILVCDGISEGDFPNREVIRLAAAELRAEGRCNDPGAAAAAVCRKALESGSKDNLSCMIVLLEGGEEGEPTTELLPGPFDAPGHSGFRQAYASMAEHAGLTLAQAVERRYDIARQERVAAIVDRSLEAGDGKDGADGNNESANGVDTLRTEIAAFGDGPPSDLAPGSPSRLQWFEEWLEKQQSSEANPSDPASMSRDQVMEIISRSPGMLAMARQQGLMRPGADGGRRTVHVASVDVVRPAVEEHPNLKWDPRLEHICGASGILSREDNSDSTAEVGFPDRAMTCWLPLSVLTVSDDGEDEDETDDERPTVVVAGLDELRPAVDEHSALRWHDRLADLCGKRGVLLQEDESDGTSQVKFPAPLSMTAWLPTSKLTRDGEASAEGGSASDPKRLRAG